jgi:hypothetical protein
VSVSSFQPLNPRQLDLQRRLLVANELEEISLITQLELYWVHRYGVSSLPKRKAELSSDVLQSSLSSEIAPNIRDLASVRDQTVETEKKSSNVVPLPIDCLNDEAGSIENQADRSSNPPLAVAPPPIALGAQRFRRWMVASSAVQDLKAS